MNDMKNGNGMKLKIAIKDNIRKQTTFEKQKVFGKIIYFVEKNNLQRYSFFLDSFFLPLSSLIQMLEIVFEVLQSLLGGESGVVGQHSSADQIDDVLVVDAERLFHHGSVECEAGQEYGIEELIHYRC